MHKRANQGGSVVAFVIIGVVLASVVGGGVYLVNQRNKQTTSQQPSTSQPAANPQETPNSGGSSNSTQSQPSSQGQSNPASSSNSQNNPPTTGVTQPTHQLPATGPAEDAFVSLIAIASLTAAATAYVRSKARKCQSLAF